MRKFVLMIVAGTALLLIAAPGANAVITSSSVTAPANQTFLNPDGEATGTVPLTISGTATGTGNVDIKCAYNNGAESTSITGAANVPVVGGNFSVTIDQNDITYYLCRFIAVPAGATAPYNLNTFQGPVVSMAGYGTDTYDTGDNSGKIYNYYQYESALEGYWSVSSAGDEVITDSYPVDPTSLAFDDTLWDSTYIDQGSDPGDPSLRLDGTNAYLPDEASDVPGLLPIQNLQRSIDAAGGGVMRVSDTEPLVLCSPDDTTCTSLSDPGVQLEQSQVGGDRGHTLQVRHRFVNTTSTAKQLDVTYTVDVNGSPPGWMFPGDGGYNAHAADDTSTPPATGPASFFVMTAAGATCSSLTQACGSLTWYQPPNSIRWISDDAVALTYQRSIPANGSTLIALNYSQGYPQSQVDGYAAAAEKGFQTSFTIGKLKRNKKKGTATLAVEVPAAGTLQVAGKDLKRPTLQADAAGTVSVPIKAKGKAKKKLKKKGKAKVKPSITYTNTGLDPTTQTTKVKLKRKKKKK